MATPNNTSQSSTTTNTDQSQQQPYPYQYPVLYPDTYFPPPSYQPPGYPGYPTDSYDPTTFQHYSTPIGYPTPTIPTVDNSQYQQQPSTTTTTPSNEIVPSTTLTPSSTVTSSSSTTTSSSTTVTPLNANVAPFYPKQMEDILDRVMATHSDLVIGAKHACQYCRVSNVESVGQCAQCHKWFCNETGATTTSHLLAHLISSHHRGFKHHPESSNNDVDLECYFCNTRNVFLLGTINTKEDNIVAIVCRTPCLLSPKLKEQNFDISSWTSIIQQKKFVSWLLNPISDQEAKSAIPITAGVINKLEELWRSDPNATIRDLYERVNALHSIEQTPDSFEHAIQYANIFHHLVNIEAETDRITKSQQCQEGLSLQWATNVMNSVGIDEIINLDTYLADREVDEISEQSKPTPDWNKRGPKNNKPSKNQELLRNKRLFATFTIFQEEETTLKIVAGDELILTFGDPNDIGKGSWVGTGYAIKVSLSGEVVMSIDDNCIPDAPTESQHGYKVQCAWKAVTYDRMHAALRNFSDMTSFVNREVAEAEVKRRQELASRGEFDNTVTTPGLSDDQPKPTSVLKSRKFREDKRRKEEGKDKNGSATTITATPPPTTKELTKPTKQCMSLNLYHQLLGITHSDEGISLPLPTELNKLEHLPPLNQYQKESILMALSQTLTLLQGPPGTGKTTTCAYLIYYLHQSLLQRQQELALLHPKQTPPKINPILVCAPSNIAVDHLTEKLHLAGLKVVRVASRSRQAIQSTVDFLSLHVLVGQLAQRAKKGRFFDLYKLMAENPLGLTPQQRTEYKALVHNVSLAILQNADVICTTCISLGDQRLFGHFQFEHVLIDEATQCPEPEILIPMTNGAKQVILVGDHCQLGPVVLSKHAAKAGYNRSLFERLLLRGHVPKMLQIQYRMHPEIAKFPANTFYDGNLTNGLKSKDRQFQQYIFPWPNQDVPLCFIASTGSIEEFSASGTSYINRYEVNIVEKCLMYLLSRGITLGQIGIITPYEGQRLHLMSILSRASSPVLQLLNQSAASTTSVDPTAPAPIGAALDALTTLNNLEIASVDSFQGREKDIILFTCVRSNEHGDLGFLCDPRRLNVALTRAKYGLIMTGNPKVLLKHPLWHALLCHFKLQNCFMEGGSDIDHLKPCSLIIPSSRTFLNARNIRIPVGFDPKTSFGMKNVIEFNKANRQVFHGRKPAHVQAATEGEGAWRSDLLYNTAVTEGDYNEKDDGDLPAYYDDDDELGIDSNGIDTMVLPTSLGR